MKTAIYLRISKDDLGEGLGIERQREAVTRLAKEKGWLIDPRWTIAENSVSAWDDSKPRPGFERLLKGIETGEVSAVVVYAFDRLARRLRDTARVLDLVDKHGVSIATATGNLDLSTAYGRGIAGILGSLANMEIASMSERLRAKAAQNAHAGRPTNGGSRPFGYEVDRMTLREDEAAELKNMAARVLAGESLSAVKNDLNARGVQATAGGQWATRTVRDTLKRPAICGRVSYKGQVLHGVTGQWPAILDEDTFDRLQLAIVARRRTQKSWDNRRVHLLSGLVKCGLCGASMFTNWPNSKRVGSALAYRCSASAHLARDKAGTDAYVVEQVKAKAAGTSFEIHDGWESAEQDQLRQDIKRLEDRRLEAAREFADGSLPADMLRMVADDLDRQLAELREKQVDHVETDLMTATHVIFQLDSFDDMSLNEQRSAIEMWVKNITIGPGKRGRGFSSDGIDIEWRDLSKLRWRGIRDT